MRSFAVVPTASLSAAVFVECATTATSGPFSWATIASARPVVCSPTRVSSSASPTPRAIIPATLPSDDRTGA
jgi:hypothetical protein